MRLFFSLCIALILVSCAMTPMTTEKINGVSFVASRDSINDVHTAPVLAINANYASIMPFGFIRDLNHPEIMFNTDRQWFGETRVGVQQYISAFHNKNIKVMMKPQIWVWRGEFTGFLEMKDEENWKLLEDSYTDFILEYAAVSQEMNVELFCIGTELEKFVSNRPEYWNELITQIKTIYKGKLTYAANWDECKRTPFWEQLDYIGIDAYFPLSDEKTPTVLACEKGWKNHKSTIKGLAEEYQKPVLFTEYGYRSVDYSAKEPWKSDREMNVVNLEAQNNATQALFNEFWDEEWFAGGFLWKWFHEHEKSGGIENAHYTPQNKPVEQLIKAQYKTK
ncbi:hypothetical protein SAMN03097699_3154 [Flavobacteriaceae bacterium MAR_2010_188]|nr:hypothetical protein SAMN03097699_3154 [Flavobacteriaceae bacterium MAR_2010_188]